MLIAVTPLIYCFGVVVTFAEGQDDMDGQQGTDGLLGQQPVVLASTLSYLQHSGSFSYTLSLAEYSSVS